MSAEEVRRLEREVAALRQIIHAVPARRVAEEMVAAAEYRCEKKLRRARKRLLLACHPDKTMNMGSKKEFSEHFTRVVQSISFK